jgi:predicted nucleic acid-binding protein
MANLRIYLDTSVFGGVFDQEFEKPSKMLFQQIKSGLYSLVTSAVVQEEISSAPKEVNALFYEMINIAEIVEVEEKALELREAYLNAKIVSPKFSDDALHVALATIANCQMLVSWNFKHIVHFDKIPLYNAINVLNGFDSISIFSPQEVIIYE